MEKIKVFEMFAGSCSFSNEAKKMNFKTFTTDIFQFGEIDYVVDIMNIDLKKIPFTPNVVWASIPCETFSISSCHHHWTPNGKPKSKECKKGIKILQRTVDIIKKIDPKYFFIENPVGLMRKQKILRQLKGIKKATICYCKYGDTRMKPTDIFTNYLSDIFSPNEWTPKEMCFNGNKKCHHQPAPGS